MSELRGAERSQGGTSSSRPSAELDRPVQDLKKRGWPSVGLTTVYAFMQAMGLVNDHAERLRPGRRSNARATFARPARTIEAGFVRQAQRVSFAFDRCFQANGDNRPRQPYGT